MSIPNELKDLRQWCWASLIVNPNTGKPDKAPKRLDGTLASVADPQSWSTYEDVAAKVASEGGAYGYVLTADDPYTIIDLDAVDDTKIVEAQRRVYEGFAGTYAEWSQSGRGTHIVLRGRIGGGIRRKGVEVYDRSRFMIFTGRPMDGRDLPIADMQELVTELVVGFGGVDAPGEMMGDHPEDEDDAAIFAALFNATNGDKFKDLYYNPPGPGDDWSQRDAALAQIIAFHTRNYDQALRLFRGSVLYNPERKAAKGGYKTRDLYEQGYLLGHTFKTQWQHLAPHYYHIEKGREIWEGVTRIGGVPITEVFARVESQFWTADTLANKEVPEREWLVHDLVPMHQVTMLGGDGGTGKSLLALQLAVAVASGGLWLNRIVHGGPAIYFGAEDDKNEMHRRLKDIATGMQIDLSDLRNLSCRSLAGEDALLAAEMFGAPLQRTGLYRVVENHIRATRPALVVIDTLADVYPANENDRAKVRQFIGMLRHWAIAYECAVVLLAHPSLTGINSGTGTSGSTGWSNSVRSRLYLRRITDQDGIEGDPDARILKTMKIQYGRTGGEIRLQWRDGAFVATEQSQSAQANPLERAERVFLKLLDEVTSQGRHVNAYGGPAHAALVFSKQPNAEGC